MDSPALYSPIGNSHVTFGLLQFWIIIIFLKFSPVLIYL